MCGFIETPSFCGDFDLMNLLQRVWRSSLGKKYLMALTGLALFGFVVGHLVGNLQVFGNPELINSYAYFLKSKPGLLWGARLGLLATAPGDGKGGRRWTEARRKM
jgi:hypothetical protein